MIATRTEASMKVRVTSIRAGTVDGKKLSFAVLDNEKLPGMSVTIPMVPGGEAEGLYKVWREFEMTLDLVIEE